MIEYRGKVYNKIFYRGKLYREIFYYTLNAISMPIIRLVTLFEDFLTYINRSDIDNGVDNYQIGETSGFTPRFVSNSFLCPIPLDTARYRRHFPMIHRFGNYSFMVYLAGNTHSINALIPHTLQFARSSDLWRTCEVIEPKVINDGGTMRAINHLLDGFFVNQPSMCETPDGRIWIYFCTFDLTVNPPTLGTQWTGGKSWLAYSSDYGDTWSEMIEIDSLSYVPGSKPIVVGNEIWATGYGYHTNSSVLVANLHSYLIKYNYVTNTVVGKYQIDADWTGLSTTEPVILEHTSGKYVCAARVNYNANFVGAETANKGMVLAYSDNGTDWSDYEFFNHDTGYPNQPRMFKHKDYIYLSYNGYTCHGKVNSVTNKIDWVVKASSLTSFLKYGWFYRQFLGSPSNGIARYNPVNPSEAVTLLQDGSIDLCVWDENKEILLAASGFRIQAGSGTYLGEPWVSVVKRNSVKADGSLTERLLYLTEIPGDDNVSNTITVYNDNLAVGDTVTAKWVDNTEDAILSHTVLAKGITFTASKAVKNAKIVYEIFKS